MRVQIVAFKRREGEKDGRKWSMVEAHAVGTVEGESAVFTFMVPREQKEQDLKPGQYDLNILPSIDRSGELVMRISELKSVVQAAKAA